MSIHLSSQFTQKYYTWTNWKIIQLSKSGNHQFDDDNIVYIIYFYDQPEVYLCTIWKNIVPDGIISGGYSQEQNDADRTDFENNYKSKSNKSLQIRDFEGRDVHVTLPRSGSEFATVTHNFCDPCTWFNGSVRITEILTNHGDGYRFDGSNINWIDMITGRVRGDDDIALVQQEENPVDMHGYQVVITIDGQTMNMCPIFSKIDGDYWINFEDGYIIFLNSQIDKTITASYSYANTSEWILSPQNGKILDIEYAEADFASDIVMNDTIQYIIYGYVDVFAPQLVPDVSSGTQIPILTYSYKRYSQILSEAVGSFPTLTPNGSDPAHRSLDYGEFRRTSRGLKKDSVSIPFRYGTKRSFSSAAGLKLVIKLVNDKKFDGESATITFYGTSKQEF